MRQQVPACFELGFQVSLDAITGDARHLPQNLFRQIIRTFNRRLLLANSPITIGA